MVENPPGGIRASLKRLRMDGRDGTIGHAEMELEGGVIMLDHTGGG